MAEKKDALQEIQEGKTVKTNAGADAVSGLDRENVLDAVGDNEGSIPEQKSMYPEEGEAPVPTDQQPGEKAGKEAKKTAK